MINIRALSIFFLTNILVFANALNPYGIGVVPPSWQFHDTILLARGSSKSSSRLGRQLADSSCSGAPFLWRIREISTGDHVGFGVGTFHLPPDIVATDTVWTSITNALADSCEVYGELNLNDPQVIAQVTACSQAAFENPVVVSNIPNETLLEEYNVLIAEMASTLSSVVLPPESLVGAFNGMPLQIFLQTVLAYNTPEYRDDYFSALFAGTALSALDDEILQQGRPAGGLEEVQTQCDILGTLNPTPDEFLSNYTEFWEPQLLDALNGSYSVLIDEYRCGNLGNIEDFVSLEEFGEDLGNALVDERNIQMADRMSDILNASTTRPLFAVGLAHWTIGENSLELLLEQEGYSIEQVTDFYDAEELEDLTDATCSNGLAPSSNPELSTTADEPNSTTTSLEPNESSVKPNNLTDSSAEPDPAVLEESAETNTTTEESSAEPTPTSETAEPNLTTETAEPETTSESAEPITTPETSEPTPLPEESSARSKFTAAHLIGGALIFLALLLT